MSDRPFRFPDLPAELRCMVYDCIEITASRNVLLQSEAGIENWIPDPIDGEKGSSITFIRPRLPLDILRTCRLVKHEAWPILQRKLVTLESLPLRSLVDANAASALASGFTRLRDCIRLPEVYESVEQEGPFEASDVAKAFIHRCEALIIHKGPLDRPSIEITLLLDHTMAYRTATTFLGMLDVVTACRAQFFNGKLKYNAPIPDMLCNRRILSGSNFFFRFFYLHFSPRTNTQGLNKEEFEKHLKDLDKY